MTSKWHNARPQQNTWHRQTKKPDTLQNTKQCINNNRITTLEWTDNHTLARVQLK